MNSMIKLAIFGLFSLMSNRGLAFDTVKPDSIWLTKCTTLAGYSYHTTITFKGENVTEQTDYFFEKDCPKSAEQVRVKKSGKNTYALRTIGADTIIEVKTNYSKLNLNPITVDGATKMTEFTICAKKDWQVGKSVDVVTNSVAEECAQSISLPWFLTPFSSFIKPKIKTGFYIGKMDYQFMTYGKVMNIKGDKLYLSEANEVLKDPVTENLLAVRIL